MINESDDKVSPPICYHSDLNFLKDEVIVVSDKYYKVHFENKVYNENNLCFKKKNDLFI
jgi:hypothetical protein